MENNEILSQILQVLIPALLTLITGWFAVLGDKIKRVYQEKINTQIKKDVVNSTVSYVQQLYKDLGGKEKQQKAIEQASLILAEKGITISEVELNMLIEAAVYGLKSSFINEEQRMKAIEANTVSINCSTETKMKEESEEG